MLQLTRYVTIMELWHVYYNDSFTFYVGYLPDIKRLSAHQREETHSNQSVSLTTDSLSVISTSATTNLDFSNCLDPKNKSESEIALVH